MNGGNHPVNFERERDVKKVFTGLTAKLPTGKIQNVHVGIFNGARLAARRRQTLVTGLWS
jgi:hypothetical protein